MATLYEKYITGDDAGAGIYGDRYGAQSFTPDTNHTITLVKIKALRVGSPGTLTLSIWDTDGEGKPTGGNLCAGTTNASAFTTDAGGAWYSISLGTGTALTATNKYAILTRVEGTTSVNRMGWRADESSATYTGGDQTFTTDGGTNWTVNAGKDFMFEEWGTEGANYPIVYTLACTNTIATKSTGHAVMNSIGGSAVTQHGHCWAITTDPTTSDSKTTLGAAPNLGHFTSAITGLTPGTTYYVRAYATNTTGTAYGDNVTIGSASTIGSREWWVEKTKFHYWDEHGAERAIEGDPETGGIPWWRYT